MKIKEKLKDRKSLIIISLFTIVSIMSLIKLTLGNSYAYYDNNEELAIVNTKIGKFGSTDVGLLPKMTGTFDFNVQIYMQDQANPNTYNLVNYPPVFGYTLDEDLSNCTPEDINYPEYSIEGDKFVIKINEEVSNQVACRIYYKRSYEGDMVIYALVRDENYGTKEYKGNKYRFIYNMPDSSYEFEDYECVNDKEKNKLTYEEGTFKVITKENDICYAYFIKNQ